MRFWSTILLILASVLCILTGIGQMTIWKPAAQITANVNAPTEGTRLTVIGHAAATLHGDTPTVTVRGGGSALIALAPAGDINAWVDDAKVQRVGVGAAGDQNHAFSVTSHGTARTFPDPAGSDLWLKSSKAVKNAALTTEVGDGQAILVAASTDSTTPSSVRVTWPNHVGTPFALPTIFLGVLLILLACLIQFLNYLRTRPGPRRHSHRKQSAKRHGTSSKRMLRAAVIPVIAISAIGLSGCSQAVQSQASKTAALSQLKVTAPITEAHFKQILASVSADAKKADATGDTNLLTARFAGPALAQRQQNAAIRAKDSSQPTLTAIASGPIRVFLPQSGASFPRTVFTIIGGSSSVNPVALTLQQADARSNYQVVSSSQLLAKVSFPDLPNARVGALIIKNTSNKLAIVPNDLVSRYADVLSNGNDSPAAASFDLTNDSFATMTQQEENDRRQQLGAAGTLTVDRAQGDAAPITMATQNSGAIVAVPMNETWTWKPAQANGTINLTDITQAMLGKSTSTTGVQQVYSTMLLFHVPVSSGGKVTLLGYSQAPIQIKEL